MRVQTKFISFVHPQVNKQEKSTNKVIYKGIKKSLDDTKGLWVDQIPLVLWSYHTAPYSTIKETPFALVYREDIMFLVEIDTTL